MQYSNHNLGTRPNIKFLTQSYSTNQSTFSNKGSIISFKSCHTPEHQPFFSSLKKQHVTFSQKGQNCLHKFTNSIIIENQMLKTSSNSLLNAKNIKNSLVPPIRFFYGSNKNKNTVSNKIKEVKLDTQQLDSKILDQRKQRKQQKKKKLKLSQKQFFFSYQPVAKYQNQKNKLNQEEDQIFQQKQELQSDYQISIKLLQPEMSYKSKIASTQATISSMKASGFPEYIKPSRQNSSSFSNNQIKNNVSLDQFSSKKLGYTIMIPQQEYNFGGIIPVQINKTTNMINKISNDSFSGITGLFHAQDIQLKQSIHCGGDIRLDNGFKILQGFGREVKASAIQRQ